MLTQDEIIAIRGVNSRDNTCYTLGFAYLPIEINGVNLRHKFHIIHYQESGVKLNGILGTDFLRMYCENFNFREHTLKFFGQVIPVGYYSEIIKNQYSINARTETLLKIKV